jgi:hypothetical protein
MRLFYGSVAKKVMATMSSPSSMVVVWWRRQWLKAIFFIYLFILWCFWFNSLELRINNDGSFFFFKVGMARRRRLKKSGGGELEVDKENVATLDEGVVEQNFVALD